MGNSICKCFLSKNPFPKPLCKHVMSKTQLRNLCVNVSRPKTQLQNLCVNVSCPKRTSQYLCKHVMSKTQLQNLCVNVSSLKILTDDVEVDVVGRDWLGWDLALVEAGVLRPHVLDVQLKVFVVGPIHLKFMANKWRKMIDIGPASNTHWCKLFTELWCQCIVSR